jgi:hypothetical protein
MIAFMIIMDWEPKIAHIKSIFGPPHARTSPGAIDADPSARNPKMYSVTCDCSRIYNEGCPKVKSSTSKYQKQKTD